MALLGFGRRDVADEFRQPTIVELVDPLTRRKLNYCGGHLVFDDLRAQSVHYRLSKLARIYRDESEGIKGTRN